MDKKIIYEKEFEVKFGAGKLIVPAICKVYEFAKGPYSKAKFEIHITTKDNKEITPVEIITTNAKDAKKMADKLIKQVIDDHIEHGKAVKIKADEAAERNKKAKQQMLKDVEKHMAKNKS